MINIGKSRFFRPTRYRRYFNFASLVCFIILAFSSHIQVEGQENPRGGGKTGTSVPGAASKSGSVDPLYQDVSSAFSQMDNAIESPNNELTPEDEYYLGRAVAAYILQNYKIYTKEPNLTRYVNKICQAMVINSPQPVLYNGYYVIILDSPEFNAFATPGGHIFLTRALIKAAESEDALAAVIAHELAHIQLHHAVSLLKDARLTQDLTDISDRAMDIASRQISAKERETLFKANVTGMINTMMINGYAQQQEYEADAAALTILQRAGYEPSSIVDVLRVLQRIQGSQPGGFNTTHPTPVQRLSNVERRAPSYRVPDTRMYRKARFKSPK
jgi:predicted Zn-dependent protease